ncbi:MAG TPA: gliding motility-associated C-terminal domain-containing protein, partial [Bacteroidia bacterium]|nr:gliding motility-associated C-terminal domain-containing protein [Bacteroidia bacterium]
NPPQVCFTTPGFHRIRLVASNSINADTTQAYIRVWPLPIADAGRDTTICQDDTIRLEGRGGVDYSWSPVNFKNSPDLPNPRVFPENEIIYYLQVSDTNGCTGTDSIKVSVIKKPELKNIDSFICLDEEIVLDAGNPGFNYLWSTGATGKFIAALPGNYFVVVNNSCFTDTVKYTVTGKDCKLDFFIPNAFSPNGDGLNDTFAITGENISHINLQVFNRWGERVFNGSGISPAWDGRFGDMVCPGNAYVYLAEIVGAKSGKKTARGVITLIR